MTGTAYTVNPSRTLIENLLNANGNPALLVANVTSYNSLSAHVSSRANGVTSRFVVAEAGDHDGVTLFHWFDRSRECNGHEAQPEDNKGIGADTEYCDGTCSYWITNDYATGTRLDVADAFIGWLTR